MQAFKAQLVHQVDGRTITVEILAEDTVAAFEARGYRMRGTYFRPGRREELQGMPIFEGLVGPCYGGEGCARYEDNRTAQEISR